MRHGAILLLACAACELPDAPPVGRTEICFRAPTAAAEPGERYSLDGVVVDDADRLFPRDTECNADVQRIDVELALPDGARARIAVVERDARNEPVGRRLDVPVGKSVRVIANAANTLPGEVVVEDEDGLLFAATGGRDTRATHVRTSFERSLGGPYRFSGCGAYEHTATDFFEGEGAIVVDTGQTSTAGGFAVTNVSSSRIAVDEGAHCTDVHDGDFVSYVIARNSGDLL